MADQSDAVLAYWSEHRQQLRQSEGQRAVLTNYILVIASSAR
jgi:soluble lytic murein transglycosylase-like protein